MATAAGVASALLMATPAVAAPTPAAVPAAPTAEIPSGLPDGLPPAALAAEPALPAADGWPASEAFSRTSGTSRLHDGALLWTDWLYDDTGAGTYTYAGANTGANGADVFRAGIAVDDDASYWRIDWNTLLEADVPIAAWAFDTDGDAATGTAEWPASAGATSPGIDASLVVSSRGAWLVDGATGDRTDLVAAGATVTVDPDARAFVVAVPRTILDVDGEWTVRLGAGVANPDGTAFAAAPEAPNGTRIYNAAFRTTDDEPHLVGGTANAGTEWNNGRQSERLASGDMRDFAIDVDWARLLGGETTPEPQPLGYSTRWYVSTADLGQGMHPAARRSPGPALQPATFFGRVQPYTVYVPTGYSPEQPAPLTILLHGGNGNHNAFLGSRKDDVYLPMCEERGSICVSPLGRGLSSWYIDEAELDVWEVWNRAAGAYALDPDRTVIGGFSMGGVGTTHFITNHPHVFAGGVIVSGAGYYNTDGVRDRPESELRVENLVNLPTFMDSGSRDVALANTQRWDRTAAAAGIPYRAHYYEGADHGQLGTFIGWSDAADYVEQHPTRVETPATVVFRWEPGDERPDLGVPVERAYWLSGLDPRDGDARWSRVTATSGPLDTAVLEPVLTDEVRVIDGRNVQVRDQRLEAVGERPARNEVDVTLENVGAVTVDLDAAGLDRSRPGAVRVTSDGDAVIRLVRGDEVAEVTVGAGDTVIGTPETPTGVRVVSGNGAARVSWTAPASDLPVTGYVVRDADGRVVCETAEMTCRIDGLPNGAAQAFTVTATSVLGSSEPTTPVWGTPSPVPGSGSVSLAVSASVQCVAGEVQLSVHVVNKEDVRVDIRITTPVKDKKVPNLKPGAATHQTFKLGVAEVAAGTVPIAGYIWKDGSGRYLQYTAGHNGISCG